MMQAGDRPSGALLERAFHELVSTPAEAVTAGAFLALIMRNGLGLFELRLFCEACKDHLQKTPWGFRVLELADMGNRARHSFHVYTAASLVVSACGIPVVNHLVRVTDQDCSKVALLEALEIPVATSIVEARESASKHHLAFLDTQQVYLGLGPLFDWSRRLPHPSFLQTALPLLHPADQVTHLVAVSREEDTELYGEIFGDRNERGVFVFGEDASAEVSLTTRTKVTEVKSGELTSYIFDPRRYGFDWTSLADLETGSISDQVDLFQRVLRDAEGGAHFDLVLLNAAFGVRAYHADLELEACLDQVRNVLSSGAAWEQLQRIQSATL